MAAKTCMDPLPCLDSNACTGPKLIQWEAQRTDVTKMDDKANHSELVGGAITILKNMKVNGKDYPIYYGQTTNQIVNHSFPNEKYRKTP